MDIAIVGVPCETDGTPICGYWALRKSKPFLVYPYRIRSSSVPSAVSEESILTTCSFGTRAIYPESWTNTRYFTMKPVATCP